MTKISAGKLRLELDDCSALEYPGVSEDSWRRFKASGSQSGWFC
ncbi:hypothetical protein [Methylotenera sp. G11]|nr:hypothetical protein [Methylotenera sp. G11]